MNALRFLIAAVLLVPLAVTAQTLRVQIINGKTGKPVAHEHVNFFRNESFSDLAGRRDVHGFMTDEDGVITTSDITSDTKTIGVTVDWHRACSKTYQWFSFSEILSTGLVSENSCKSKINRGLDPGTLIIFVRNETFFEKMAS
jgi:hypothetical protein